ncbi:hypothetical protein niasHT_016452 [Heterodera trifolii]|uniref:Uncharacterized protein n=1 Tax=Heterodera trifolii TaxID=157864 RepID=A0ABD2L1X8_9BILA
MAKWRNAKIGQRKGKSEERPNGKCQNWSKQGEKGEKQEGPNGGAPKLQRHRGGRGTVNGRFVVGGRVDWLVEPGQAGGGQQMDGVAGQNIEQFEPGQAGGGQQMEGVVAGPNIEQFVPFC